MPPAGNARALHPGWDYRPESINPLPLVAGKRAASPQPGSPGGRFASRGGRFQ
ncbi:MAG: hypothetical protein LBQ54_08280 [Planctomycetaceae bacterium]|nr:hypothetical protein [Planctomycetaceae bacterium]